MRVVKKSQVLNLKKAAFAGALLSSFVLCLYFQLRFHDSLVAPKSSDLLSFSAKAGTLLPFRSFVFAGETIPGKDSLITHRLAMQLDEKKKHLGQYRLFLYRAKTWFPIIEPILEKHGIPDDFKYVALIESNLSNVVSPKGATGFWQFVPESGAKCGLEINEYVDERYHVEKSTEAACLYFKQAYGMFGNWTLAAASFNIGLGGILNQVKEQPASTYFDMSFNTETTLYIYKLIATKEVLSRPRYYGILKAGRVGAASMRYNRVDVDYTIEDLDAWAQAHGISLRMLKHYNPWLVGKSLPAREGKTYKLRIPGANYSPDLFKELFIPGTPDSVQLVMGPDSLKISNFAVRDSGVTVK